MSNLQKYSQARATIDKDDIELAERLSARSAERQRLSRKTGSTNVWNGPPLRLREIDDEIKEIETARASLAEQRAAILKEEGPVVRASLQSTVDAEYRKLAPAALQVFESLKVIENTKDTLMRRGFGFHPVPCYLDTDDVLKDAVLDRTGGLARLLRQCAERGLCKLPSELR